MNVLLLQTGSVSAKLSDKLIEEFILRGHVVKDYMTYEANYIYNKLSGKQKYKHFSVDEETVEYRDTSKVRHIEDVRWADVCVLAPADFNTIGKVANGIADNFVTSALAAWIGTGKPLYIADAMNTFMWMNPIYQQNRKKLDSLFNVFFIQPTVKRLACGDVGIGGLADIKTIVDVVEGHVWRFPIETKDLIPLGFSLTADRRSYDFANYVPKYGEPGYFGAVRKHDIHEGIDIYCMPHATAHAVEDGEVVDSYQYTGAGANCDWWNDTWCVKVKGKSGVVTYGELEMPEVASSLSVQYPVIGSQIKAGDKIGIIGQVLKDGKHRPDIRNHSTSMLHIELRKESCHLDGWKLDSDRDPRLLDPAPFLLSKKINSNVS